MRRRGVRQPAPLRRRRRRGAELRVARLERPGHHVRDHRAATPTWSRSTALASRTRSPPASRSRSTGSCPTTPTSPRSAKSGRFTGLNPAYIDGSAVYHSPEDTTVLHGPGQPAAPRRQRARAGPRVRRRRPGRAGASRRRATPPTSRCCGYLVRYPAGWSGRSPCSPCSPSAALASWPAAAGCVTYGRVAAGFGLALVPLLLAPVLAQLLWPLLVAIRPGYREMIDPWRPGWFRLGVVALVATVVLTWYGLLRKRFGALGADPRRPGLAGLARAGAGRRHARRVLPGRAAGAGRSPVAGLVALTAARRVGSAARPGPSGARSRC